MIVSAKRTRAAAAYLAERIVIDSTSLARRRAPFFFALAALGASGCVFSEDSGGGAAFPDAEQTSDADAAPEKDSEPDAGRARDAESDQAEAGVAQPCARDEYVEDRVCVRCPEVGTNEPNDDPTQGDTFCDFEPCARAFGAACDSLSATLLKAEYARQNDLAGNSIALGDDFVFMPIVSDPSCSVGQEGEPDDDRCRNRGAVSAFRLDHDDNLLRRPDLYVKPPREPVTPTGAAPETLLFGSGVSYGGEWLAVGASGSNSETGCGADAAEPCIRRGELYLYKRSGIGEFIEQPIALSAAPLQSYDAFGSIVSIDVGRVAVSSLAEASCSNNPSNDECARSGAVYIFDETRPREWSQRAYLKADRPKEDERFGRVLSLDGDRLAVGVPGNDDCARGISNARSPLDGCTGSGAVYIFEYNADSMAWSQTAYIKSSNALARHAFGSSLVLRGSTLFVGAPREESCGSTVVDPSPACEGRGAVYLFERSESSGRWSEVASLKPPVSSNAQKNTARRFGHALALVGETLAVGAPFHPGCGSGWRAQEEEEGDQTCAKRGAVYLFERGADRSWGQVGLFKPPAPKPPLDLEDHEFGSALAFERGALAIGAIRDDRCGPGNAADAAVPGRCDDSGAVYLWRPAPQ